MLEQWQQEIVDAHPGPVPARACPLRRLSRDELGPGGLVAGEMKRYEYPRYFFSNKSLDILALCCAALHRLGIAYRRPRWDQVSVARRVLAAASDEDDGVTFADDIR